MEQLVRPEHRVSRVQRVLLVFRAQLVRMELPARPVLKVSKGQLAILVLRVLPAQTELKELLVLVYKVLPAHMESRVLQVKLGLRGLLAPVSKALPVQSGPMVPLEFRVQPVLGPLA